MRILVSDVNKCHQQQLIISSMFTPCSPNTCITGLKQIRDYRHTITYSNITKSNDFNFVVSATIISVVICLEMKHDVMSNSTGHLTQSEIIKIRTLLQIIIIIRRTQTFRQKIQISMTSIQLDNA